MNTSSGQAKHRNTTKTSTKQSHKNRLTHKPRQKASTHSVLRKPLRSYQTKESPKGHSLTQAAKNIPKKVSGKLQEKLAQKLVARAKQVKSSKSQPSPSSQHLKELDTYKKELNQYKQNILYLKAEFENYKKRHALERSDLLKYRSEQLAIEILEVVDTFERALSYKIDPKNVQSFADGMKMVYSAFITALKKHGIEEVLIHGKVFDPHLCDALSKEPTTAVPTGHVSQVIKKPYKLHEKIIRFGQVVVAQPVTNKTETDQQTTNTTP